MKDIAPEICSSRISTDLDLHIDKSGESKIILQSVKLLKITLFPWYIKEPIVQNIT